MEGPTVVQVPVALPASRGKIGDEWVLDDSPMYGVKVVETPLALCVDDSLPGERHGALTIAVEAGVSLLVSPTSFPWKVGPSSSELKAAAAVSSAANSEAAFFIGGDVTATPAS